MKLIGMLLFFRRETGSRNVLPIPARLVPVRGPGLPDGGHLQGDPAAPQDLQLQP